MNDQERAAFEAWGRAEGLEDKAIGRGMDYPLGEHLWRAWQAGRAALAAAPQVPAVPVGYKLLKDTTHDERRWHEDAKHENGSYFNECVRCLRSFVGHKRRGVCRACAQPEAVPAQPAPQAPLDVCTDPYNCKRCAAAQWDKHKFEHAGIAAGVKEPGNVRGEAGQTAPPALDTEPN